jgi:hypothetical protein
VMLNNGHRGTAITHPDDPPHLLESHLVDLPAQLVDQLADLIVRAPGPAGRAAVITAIITELHALVAWTQPAANPATEELAGTRGMVAAANAHLRAIQSDPT